MCRWFDHHDATTAHPQATENFPYSLSITTYNHKRSWLFPELCGMLKRTWHRYDVMALISGVAIPRRPQQLQMHRDIGLDQQLKRLLGELDCIFLCRPSWSTSTNTFRTRSMEAFSIAAEPARLLFYQDQQRATSGCTAKHKYLYFQYPFALWSSYAIVNRKAVNTHTTEYDVYIPDVMVGEL